MKKKTITKYGSVLTGLILGYLLGFFANGILPMFNYATIIYFGVPIAFFTYLSTKKPKFVEYLAYALAVFIVLQFLWDYLVGDRNSIRSSLFYGAIVSLLLNIFTGRVKLIGAKKTFRRAIGL